MISYLEWAANGVYIISVVLAAKNHVYTWWTGIIGCLLFAALFYQVNLYADVTLMIFFITTSLYGWMYWGHTKEQNPVRKTSPRSFIIFFLGAILASLLYGWILHLTTAAYAPFIDSAILMFSVLAQFLLMKRRVETWICWLVVNTIAVPLYTSRELYLTAVVYAIFWCNTWYGLYKWQKIIKQLNNKKDSWQQNTMFMD